MKLDQVKIYKQAGGNVQLDMKIEGGARTLHAEVGPFVSTKEALDFAVVIETSLERATAP